MNLSFLDDRADRWEQRAKELRASFGAEEAATTLERAAQDLRETLQEGLNEPLTLQEAELESGYSPDHLSKLLREGKLPNAGEAGSPRIRRRNLPRKVEHCASGPVKPPANGDDPAIPSRSQVARTVVESD